MALPRWTGDLRSERVNLGEDFGETVLGLSGVESSGSEIVAGKATTSGSVGDDTVAVLVVGNVSVVDNAAVVGFGCWVHDLRRVEEAGPVSETTLVGDGSVAGGGWGASVVGETCSSVEPSSGNGGACGDRLKGYGSYSFSGRTRTFLGGLESSRASSSSFRRLARLSSSSYLEGKSQ